MNWNFKFDEAPVGDIWAATKRGTVRHAYRYHLLSRWHGVQSGDELIAWQPYVVPLHPHHMPPADLLPVSADAIPIIEDVGGGA